MEDNLSHGTLYFVFTRLPDIEKGMVITMNSDIPGLRPIAIEFLLKGMQLDQEIYNYSGKVLLIRKGVMITEDILSKLRKFNSNNRNICVREETYYFLLEKSKLAAIFGQEQLEDRYGYTKLKEAASIFFHACKNTSTVSQAETKKIVDDISGSLAGAGPSIVFQFINAPRPVDESLQRHSINVSFLNGLMGEWLELPQEEINALILAGLVHDIGKTKIPPEILDAPRKLTKEEFELVKCHPLYSYELLCKDEAFEDKILLAAKQHHEKVTGGGYPDNLLGSAISLFARITSISDIYDAMISKRSYKEANNPLAVLDQFAKREFAGLDSDLVDLFVKNMPSKLIHKQVLMSDGTIGTIRYLMPNDLGRPVVDVDGEIRQGDENWFCERIIS